MGIEIQIDAPHLLPHLIEGLVAGGCSAEIIDAGAARVVHGQALDETEAMTELRFFLRAWARGHGDVTVRLLPAV